jgi:uncharacterized integral membrane protein
MNFLETLAFSLFDVTSIWSVVIRAIFWMIISVIILIATDNPEVKKVKQDTKSYLGLFLMVVAVSTTLIFLLFGITPI